MNVIDRFLNAMKMNDDDDLTEDEYLDDEDDEEDLEMMDEEPQRRHLIPHRNSANTQSDPDSSESSDFNTSAGAKSTKTRQSRSPKVTSIRGGSASAARKSGMEVCVIRPTDIEDAREITDTLLDECTVILNFEGIDFELSQRIIDFACGSTYAMHGNLQKVSNYIFILTPASVDISGDIQDMVTGMYDVPTFDTNY